MTKFVVFILIFTLIISTSIIKNSTKGIEDVKENLLFLESRFKDTKLEFDFLSSSEKLMEYQQLYFENSLQIKSLQEIKTLEIYNDEIKIGDLKISGKNDQ